MKSDAVFFRLPGVRRLRTGGRSSSSFLFAEGVDGEAVVGCCSCLGRRRDEEDFFSLGLVVR